MVKFFGLRFLLYFFSRLFYFYYFFTSLKLFLFYFIILLKTFVCRVIYFVNDKRSLFASSIHLALTDFLFSSFFTFITLRFFFFLFSEYTLYTK